MLREVDSVGNDEGRQPGGQADAVHCRGGCRVCGVCGCGTSIEYGQNGVRATGGRTGGSGSLLGGPGSKEESGQRAWTLVSGTRGGRIGGGPAVWQPLSNEQVTRPRTDAIIPHHAPGCWTTLGQHSSHTCVRPDSEHFALWTPGRQLSEAEIGGLCVLKWSQNMPGITSPHIPLIEFSSSIFKLPEVLPKSKTFAT
jgi:hypothetical protein